MVTTNKIDRITKEPIRKPNCIVKYNKYMELIDKCDMQLSFNDSGRKSVKLYKKLPFHFFDLMFYNAYVLFKEVCGEKKLKFSAICLRVIAQTLKKYGLHQNCKNVNNFSDGEKCLYERHFPLPIIVQNEKDDINDQNDENKSPKKKKRKNVSPTKM